MKNSLIILLVLLTFSVISEEDPSDNYVLLLNGGGDQYSNLPRYFQNTKAMYRAFKSLGISDEKIAVLYGNGNVEDTRKSFDYFLPDPSIPFNQENLFGGVDRNVTGEASKEKLEWLQSRALELVDGNDQLTIFITDHGALSDQGESEVVLWNKTISVEELGELLQQIPAQVHIVTNICYGGGLAELTQPNICVMANQSADHPSESQNDSIDLYAQNFARALETRLDWDGDGRSTYLDAHMYATQLDARYNVGTTSLDYFLLSEKDYIDNAKESAEQSIDCIECLSQNFAPFADVINSLDDLVVFQELIHFDPNQLATDRKELYSARLSKLVESYNNEPALFQIGNRIKEIYRQLDQLASDWDKLSANEQQVRVHQAHLEADILFENLRRLMSDESRVERLQLELDLLQYGSDQQIEKYKEILECLEYEY